MPQTSHITQGPFGLHIVDDFFIKYCGKEHVYHLLGVLKKYYKVEEDWTGSLYCMITLDWYYNEQYVDIPMPIYVYKKLINNKWRTPKRHQHCLYQPNLMNYGKKLDLIIEEPVSPLLDENGKKYIQQVVGLFTTNKAHDMNPKTCREFLDYMETHQNTKTTFELWK